MYLALSLLLAGCAFELPENLSTIENPQESTTASPVNSVLATIDNAEGTVQLMVEGNEQLTGAVAEITGDTVTHIGGQIIQSNHNVADWGGDPEGAYFFDGSYNITGSKLLQTRFCFTRTQPQNFDPLSCGVNFYDLIMKVEGFAYTGACVLYGKELKAIEAEGIVSFLIFPISEEMKTVCGADMITLSCSVEKKCDIAVTWTGTEFSVESTGTISECMVMTEVGENKYVVNSQEPGTHYMISIKKEPIFLPVAK